MVISKIVGGLGNQMFQYAIAKSISRKNNISFCLDLEAFKTYKLFDYKLDNFNIENYKASISEIKAFNGDSSIYSKIKRELHLSKYFYKEKKRHIFDDEVFKYKNIYLSGYWQNEEYFIDIKDELINDFKPIIKMSDYVQKLHDKILKFNSVSIHVRRGDYIKHPEIGLTDIGYYKSAIDILNSKLSNPVYFIFSNDIRWCKNNFKFLDNYYIVDETDNEIEDFTLMRGCNHNIIANSTFSWWAAWLNNYVERIIIAPNKWRADTENSSFWLPSKWMKI